MAAFLPYHDHMRLERPPTVAEGLKTISGAVQPESLPVERMVPPVAYVDRDLAERSLEDRVPVLPSM